MPFTEIENIRLFYEVKGSGSCVLLMLPGSLGTTRLEFDRQFRGLDCDKLMLVSWDAPGFGQSRPPDRDYNNCYENDARLLYHLMTQVLGIQKFNVLGFSDGGRTAIRLAVDYPKAVEKLILVGTTTFNSPKERTVLQLWKDINSWSDERLDRYGVDYADREELQTLWSNWIQANDQLADFLTDKLAQIEAHTLLLYGQDDIVAPVQPHLQHMKKRIRNCRKHVFPSTSHNCHQEEWREFNRIVESFLLK